MTLPLLRLLVCVVLLAISAAPAAAQDQDSPTPQHLQLRNGGAVLTGVGLGVVLGGSALAALGQQTAADAVAAAEYQDAQGHTYLDPAAWVVYEDDFEAGRSLNRGGWVMLGVGSAATVAGLILLVRGAHLQRRQDAPLPTAVITPQGVFVGVTGRF